MRSAAFGTIDTDGNMIYLTGKASLSGGLLPCARMGVVRDLTEFYLRQGGGACCRWMFAKKA